MHFNIHIPDEHAMQAFGSELSRYAENGMVIFLRGGLGAGKTTFTRGFLRGLGFDGHVKSPTYTIVESYELPKVTVFHFDFYRVKDPLELEYLGLEEYFSKNSICLIEWPDAASGMLPQPDLLYVFTTHQNQRQIDIEAKSDMGKKILGRLQHVG